MSDGNFRILSVCSTSTSNTSLYVGLKYLLKVSYIILYYPKVARFFIFETLCLGSSKTLPYVWKKYHKNEWHLRLVTQIFTECVSNQYTHFDISKYQMRQQVMVSTLILLRFLCYYIHYWWPFMSELLYLQQTFTDCVSNEYTHSLKALLYNFELLLL